MEFEKFTERSREFIQSAQNFIVRLKIGAFSEHFLKVFLDDEEGLAARLIVIAGGDIAELKRISTRSLKRSPLLRGLAPDRYISTN